MIRIGSFAAQNLTLSQNLETQARIQEARVQISSGKKAQTYDGIARETRRLEGLETRHARASAFVDSIERTDQRLQEMESAVANVFDVASDFRALLLDAGSGGKRDTTNITAQAQRYLDSVVGDLNTKMANRYLFSGSATTTQPVNVSGFTPGTTDYYEGNGQILNVRVANDMEIDYGVTADDPAFRDVLGSLQRMIDAAGANDATFDAALDTSLGELNSALQRLPDVRADLGSARDVLDKTRERLLDQNVATETSIGDVENVDVTEAMTKLSADQVTLESSYAITARLSRVSLLNYLR